MIKKSAPNYILSLIISFISIFFITIASYYFFIRSFESLERKQNIKNIHTVLKLIDDRINFLKMTISDYAEWDETYNFIKTKNKQYTYENFRDESATLETLKIDFLIFTDLNNKEIFSTHLSQTNMSLKSILLENFKGDKEFSTIFWDSKNNKFYYLVRERISNSDGSLKPNGFIYAGKEIVFDTLDKTKEIFSTITIQHNAPTKTKNTLHTKYFQHINLSTSINSNYRVENIIDLYDYHDNYVLSINTQSIAQIIIKGNKTIFYYNIFITIFLFLVFFFILKFYSMIGKYNEKLEIEVAKKTKELKILAEQDELTKINNRRNFFALGKNILHQAIANNEHFSVSMIDIDDFKLINDTYGHHVGDLVLTKFCQCVNEELSKKDIFGRLGGEEFVIIFNNSSLEEANNIAEKIRKKIEKEVLIIGKHKVSFTISIGIVSRDDSKSIDEILIRADSLLYKAKRSGKNSVRSPFRTRSKQLKNTI